MICAFDIGGSKIACGSVEGAGDVGACVRIETPTRDYQAFLSAVADQVPNDARALGLSIAGLVDPNQGSVRAANIPCLSGKPLRDDLTGLIGKPVFLTNDAKAFGLAEAHNGAGVGHSSVLALIPRTGIGGAIVLDGRILEGRTMVAGEWGHGPAGAMRTGKVLPRWTCGCGEIGCVDLFGGARGLERLHGFLAGEDKSSFDILDGWCAGESAALDTVDLYLDIVCGALANLVNTVDPSIIVLGGGLVSDTSLVSALHTEMWFRILAPKHAPRFAKASVGANSAIIGAAIFSRERLSLLKSEVNTA
ncbi:ROK family protein [Labrenzia sp. 011]|uniref:ROK family protein n=1 Tax=Labrenzia sp. 011 TaxID=2171494 RepID=UPI000D509B38|nr:ROK family protein [Labrenzia sp. 011]PVB60600.1 N-acetylglucosamine kinase [Labrenzia sp. 011]